MATRRLSAAQATTPTSCTPGAGSKSLLEATLHQAGADVIPSARDVGLLSTQTVAQPRTGEPSSSPSAERQNR
jgi:hypothetical protein